MRPQTQPLISVREAVKRLLAVAQPFGTEQLPWTDALGRVLAETVVADRPFPAADRSAMDGFAVRAADAVKAGAQLRVVGEQPAGAPRRAETLLAGEAVKVFTGAVIPAGADAVVMVEHTEPALGEVQGAPSIVLQRAVEPGQHIRRLGTDLDAGAAVLEPGIAITAAEMAALASVGHLQVRAYRQPRVAVLSTGDEVIPPEATPAEHQVRNSNNACLVAQLAALGLASTPLATATDETGLLDQSIKRGLTHDVLLVTGGVSVGDYDLVRQTLEANGVEILFHGVAMKPGKPILAGRQDSRWVIGLPGNPVSAFAGFVVMVTPLLRRLMGMRHTDNLELPARLTTDVRCRPGRETYHLARLQWQAGEWTVSRIPTTGSGDVLAMARANAFLITSKDTSEVSAGQVQRTLPWPGFEAR